MKVSELIAKLNELPQDFEVLAGSGSIVALWVSNDKHAVDIDYGNSWHTTADGDPSFTKHWDAMPGVVVAG